MKKIKNRLCGLGSSIKAIRLWWPCSVDGLGGVVKVIPRYKDEEEGRQLRDDGSLAKKCSPGAYRDGFEGVDCPANIDKRCVPLPRKC
jgi:hypothetical protein